MTCDHPPRRAGWRVGDRVIGVDRPVVMGIVNVTPDSFSDGGVAFGADDHPERAIARALAMVADGADVIDVGGESTRPGSAVVTAQEEVERVVPVVDELVAADVVVSIDTTKSAVAAAALDRGALIVNDISAGRFDPQLLPLVVASDVAYVLMHMQGTPATMQRAPHYDDVVAEVTDFLVVRRDELVADGLAVDRIAIDPGIGFGKDLDHNLALLRAVGDLARHGPVLVGASRKSFLGRLTGVDDPAARDPASVAAATLAMASGAGVVRVHDVAATRQAVDVAWALSER